MMSDPSGWATTRLLPLPTCTIFITSAHTWMEFPMLPESTMTILGPEGLSCNGITDKLGGGGVKTTKIIYSMYYTIYNI